MKRTLRILLVSIFSFFGYSSFLTAAPLKVYILCGQSNMEGHAKVSTIDAMAQDPATAPIRELMVDKNGKPRICDQVWISYFTGGRSGMGEGFGQLTTGYGARSNPTEPSEKFGPELTFGIFIEKALGEPVLIIKTAWGGKSLNTDFRSPSAGPYVFNDRQIENIKKRGQSLEEVRKSKVEATGYYYQLMLKHVLRVLGDIKRVYPGYDPKQGYELDGFIWFQGWNDMVDSGTYPQRGQPGGYNQYTKCMKHFIRDVRKDLKAPDMKFVIGVMGVNGPLDKYLSQRYVPIHGGFREAMAAAANEPDFEGNVIAVRTAPFWDMRLKEYEDNQNKVKQMAGFLKNKAKGYANADGSMDEKAQKKFIANYKADLISAEDEAYVKTGRSNAAFHYYGSGKTMAQIGKAFADAIKKME